MSSLNSMNVLMARLCDPAGIAFAVQNVCRPDDPYFDDEEAAAHLMGEEREIYQTIRSPKRRREFVAGRMAAKQAFSVLSFPDSVKEIEIGRELSGAPKIRNNPDVHLSISHSNAFAVAVAASFRVGVDLECNSSRPPSLVRYFFADNERRLLNAMKPSGRDRVVNQLWTRKEAASKVGEWGGSLSFRDVDCVGRTVSVMGHTLVLRSGSTGGFVSSVAFEKEGSNG